MLDSVSSVLPLAIYGMVSCLFTFLKLLRLFVYIFEITEIVCLHFSGSAGSSGPTSLEMLLVERAKAIQQANPALKAFADMQGKLLLTPPHWRLPDI